MFLYIPHFITQVAIDDPEFVCSGSDPETL